MKDVALITLHGMGKVKEHYYDDLEEGVRKKLGSKWDKVSFQTIQYAPILQTPQDDLWDAIKSNNDVDATKLRQFFLYGFGDAGSLEYSAHKEKNNVAYIEVQREIQKALKEAYNELGRDKSKPVVIIAQSLGCQVISNYLWDAKKGTYIFESTDNDTSDEMEFLRLKSLRNLVTTGCNIPLFIGGIKKRECFEIPHPQFQWDNYYDPDDVLGWPLKQLGPTFEFINDHDINAGGFFTSWNPLSHGKYWSDKDVINPLANILKSLL